MSNDAWGRLVFIGRFQPLHRGHMAVIELALQRAERLSVLIGSAHQARSVRNVWTADERIAMFRSALSAEQLSRIDFGYVEDVFYDEAVWMGFVQDAVATHPQVDGRTAIIGHDKDSSSYYLKIFPDWEAFPVANYGGFNATPLREALLQAGPDGAAVLLAGSAGEILPDALHGQLSGFLASTAFARLCEEFAVIRRWRESWAASPYPPVFVTVDALVEHRDAVLMIRRGQAPGAGLLALPGGFIEPGERLLAAARRELREETNLDLGGCEPLSQGSYDHPDRSARGRFITHLFHFRLPDEAPRPVVRGGDDAASAHWCEWESADPESFFEDHRCIMQHRLGRYPHTTAR